MQDNVSVLIATIMAVVIIVLFPIYNIATRNDSIASNMVVKATTNFVDEVRNKGYIDKKSYESYIFELGKTGNMYDVEMEVYKPILLETKESTDENKEYKEEYVIEYTEDILEAMTNNETETIENEVVRVEQIASNDVVVPADVYYLNEGYKFYVRVKNTNITQAQVLLSRLLSGSDEERIVVNYGGIVYSNEWEKGEEAEEINANISLSRPLNSEGLEYRKEYISNVYDMDLDEERTIYAIAVRISDDPGEENEIYFKLTYTNVEKITNINNVKDKIKVEGIAADISLELKSSNDNGDGTWNYEYMIKLSNIGYDFNNNRYKEAKVMVESGSAYTKVGPVSAVNSQEFIVFYNIHLLELEGNVKYYRIERGSYSLDDYPWSVDKSGLASYAHIEIKSNVTNDELIDIKYAEGIRSEAYFESNPSGVKSIKSTYNRGFTYYYEDERGNANTASSNIESYMTDKITESGTYTFYAKDSRGRTAIKIIEVEINKSDRIVVELEWDDAIGKKVDLDIEVWAYVSRYYGGTGVYGSRGYYEDTRPNTTSFDMHVYGRNLGSIWRTRNEVFIDENTGTESYKPEKIILNAKEGRFLIKAHAYIGDLDYIFDKYGGRQMTWSERYFWLTVNYVNLNVYRGEEGEEKLIFNSKIDYDEPRDTSEWNIFIYNANTKQVSILDNEYIWGSIFDY